MNGNCIIWAAHCPRRIVGFLDILRHPMPSTFSKCFLRKIALDGSSCVYFFEEGCNRERGSHVGHGYATGQRNLTDVVWERIVGVPVLGP